MSSASPRLLLSLGLACVCASACAASSADLAPTTARPLPHAAAADGELTAFGRRLYAALGAGRPGEVLFAASALERLLTPDAAEQVLLERAHTPGPTRLPAEERALWRRAQYAELCIQQGRLEPRDGPLGLRAPGFTFERALLIGSEPDGGALAGWVEGVFLYTDQGFAALRLERVETPRRDHADLELALCELRARVTRPKR